MRKTGKNHINLRNIALGTLLLAGIKIGDEELSSELQGPWYPLTVQAGQCARYARLGAQDVFGIIYPRADAWKMRYQDGVSGIQVNSNEDLRRLASQGMLNGGSLIGFNYPHTRESNRELAHQNGVDYTHLALFLEMKDGKLYFADKFGPWTRRRISLEDMEERNGLTAREVLFKSDN